jgi:hypothetical protein
LEDTLLETKEDKDPVTEGLLDNGLIDDFTDIPDDLHKDEDSQVS